MTSEPGSGVPDLVRALEELSPMVGALRQLQRHCKPFGSDYDAVAVSLAALDEVAQHFTDQRAFFGSRSDSVGPVLRWADKG